MDQLILAFALILAGFLFMAAELVLYTHGVLSMLGLGATIIGAVVVFGRDPVLGTITFLALVVAVPVCGRFLLMAWPKSPMGRRMVLHPPAEQATISLAPHLQELENLRGHFGKTLSALRPAGAVDFDGRRVDAMSEGTMIDADQWVRCVDVRQTTVIVRIADGPPESANLEDMKF